MKVLPITIAGLGLQLFASALIAQVPDDDVRALEAALPAIMTKAPAGPTALVYNGENTEVAQKLAARIGKRIEHESSKLDCRHDATTGRDVCSLKDAGSLVNLGDVKIAGNKATIVFDIETPSGSSHVPIEHKLFAARLVRIGNGWKVVKVRSIGMS